MSENPEADPTAVDPSDATADPAPESDAEQQGRDAAESGEGPPKPPIEDMPPEEGHDPPSDEEEAEVEQAQGGDVMSPEDADADDTVDNAEAEEPRHDDLPEGARREDYGDGDA